jgi:hypothetical protein
MNGVPQPTIRYLILCDEVLRNPLNPRHVSIVGLLSSIRSAGTPPYPFRLPEFFVLVLLAEGRGGGTARIEVVQADTNTRIFQTATRGIVFPPDPLEVSGLTFRIRWCLFPSPGLYWVQFWYDDAHLAQQPLLMR